MITVTENATRYLHEFLAEKGASPEEKGLRLAVQRGGCAGMQYVMKISEPEATDSVVESGGVRFFLAEDSLPYLQGCQVDYEDSLNDSGFKISNPNAARSCGCGTSFEAVTPGQAPSYDSSQDGSVCGGDDDDS